MAVVTVGRLSEIGGNHHRLDAEFYQPQYVIDFSKGNWKPIKTFLDTCQYGISQAMTEEPHGYPIFRMDDIKNCFLVDDDVKYIEISSNVFERFRLEKDDILFNRVNSEEFVGRTGIFKLTGNYVFASYLVRLRIRSGVDILPDYLNIFLNTEFGKKQIRRFSRRAVNQANVNAEELRNFKICIIPMAVQEQIAGLCRDAWNDIERSKSLYHDAEKLLLEKLGLDDFKPQHHLAYENSLSNAFTARRLDAEFFQPAYESVIRKLQSEDHIIISQVQVFNKRGVQPTYLENGEARVVTSKHLGTRLLDSENLDRTNIEEWKKNLDAQVRKLDVLIYTTGAYVGRTNSFLDNQIALASNHVNILRVKELNPIYLAVFLNSILGQMQVRKFVSGSAQVELYSSDIARFTIWKPSPEIQKQIAGLVLLSHEAKSKAVQLLNEAKAKAEQAIRDQMMSR
jgi:restriction endonuclease S subunit